jgi:hypothetical protein
MIGRLPANLDKLTNLGKLPAASAICANPMQAVWDLAELAVAPEQAARDREVDDLKQQLNAMKEQMEKLNERVTPEASRAARKPKEG